jgi:hypothetical protein
LRLKQAGILEAAIDALVAAARVDFPSGSSLAFNDSVVAQVGERAIMASDLVAATYSNPQIQQALSPENAFIITAFFKPSVLDQLVEQELALLASEGLEVEFFGPRSFAAQSVLSYVTRDASVGEAEIAEFYEANRSTYTTPASAQVTQLEARTLNAALAARAALQSGAAVDGLGENVTVTELGLVTRGRLEPLLDLTLFETDGFTFLPDGEWEVSDVLVLEVEPVAGLPEDLDVAADREDGYGEAEAVVEPSTPVDLLTGEARYVVLVAQRSPERVRPLADVRAQIQTTVLNGRRDALREDFLAVVRETVTIELMLPDPFGGMFNSTLDFGAAAADDEAEGEDAPANGD